MCKIGLWDRKDPAEAVLEARKCKLFWVSNMVSS